MPEHVDAAKYAPILCAGVTVFASMRRMNVRPGATVAIQGLGGLGHLAIQYANKFGWRVVALSRGSEKEKFAKELGAHEYIDATKVDPAEALQKFGGASLIVATAPNGDAIKPLVGGLGVLGKLLILSGKSHREEIVRNAGSDIVCNSRGRDPYQYHLSGKSFPQSKLGEVEHRC